MPPTRSASSQSTNSNIEINSKEQRKQWVMLVNDEAFKLNPDEENKPVLCRLKHPRTEQGSYYMFTHGDRVVHELNQFSEKYRSWFIGETVQKDGSMMLVTEMDSLFLVLPYLMEAEKSGKYMTLDQIILDSDYSECNRLQSTSGMSELHHVTDMKGSDDLRAYKYNKEKTLSWLKAKTERLADNLSENNVCTDNSHSSVYVKSKRNSSVSSDDYLRNAHGIVSDYLNMDLTESLREYLGLPVICEKSKDEPPSKKLKTEDGGPLEDYSLDKDKKKPAKLVKQTTAQKKLSQVDKSGMKNISSFFAKSKT